MLHAWHGVVDTRILFMAVSYGLMMSFLLLCNNRSEVNFVTTTQEAQQVSDSNMQN